MVMNTPFYLFGSENSQDYDLIVSVDSIPQDIHAAHNICKYWNSELSNILTDKPLNTNLGVFQNGSIIKVFKGLCAEVNNSIYYTYDFHKQYYTNPIIKPVEQNIDFKILRVARYLLTFYSRVPALRTEIKAALRGNLILKLNVLKQFNYEKMTDFPMKKERKEDIYKVLAFQFGQVFSLINGWEKDSYTKNGIIKNFPELSNFINRKPITTDDLIILNDNLNKFIQLIESKITTINLIEPIQ